LFFLFNNYLATSAKYLGGNAINVHENYDDLCIGSSLAAAGGDERLQAARRGLALALVVLR
jgi:hypothetical protein